MLKRFTLVNGLSFTFLTHTALVFFFLFFFCFVFFCVWNAWSFTVGNNNFFNKYFHILSEMNQQLPMQHFFFYKLMGVLMHAGMIGNLHSCQFLHANNFSSFDFIQAVSTSVHNKTHPVLSSFAPYS